MAKIFNFVPRRDLDAKQNLDAFISMSRDLIPTWSEQAGFAWESYRWVTIHRAIRFTNYENSALHASASPASAQLMHPDFMEAAKAYLRYRHHTRPHLNIARELTALRALEYSLRIDGNIPDITKVNQRNFDEATALLSQRKAAHLVAAELLNILKTLADLGIVTSAAHYWNHQFHGDLSYDRQFGASATKELKDKKLPNQDALLAIGEVFGRGYEQPLEGGDVLITSITAILLCAPIRISEVRRFRMDCLAQDVDRDGNTQYYFKYWVPKTKEFCRKPIPRTMAEIAIEAIRRLQELTEEGRRLARYMEGSPSKFYRHKNCPEVADDQVLSPDQVRDALGFFSIGSATSYVESLTGQRRLTGHTLNTLWSMVVKDHHRLNPHFPYQEPAAGPGVLPLKMSESLLCCLRHQFSTGWVTSPILLTPFRSSYYGMRLDGKERTYKNSGRPLCFYTRHGFEPKKLKSHSYRHLLNRLAKQSGVTIDVITAWSSRTSNRQTLTYLDNDEGKTASAVAAMMDIEIVQAPKDPITSEEAEIYGQGPIHRSRYGLCRRSWRVGPCNKFADCLNCSELLMCKGDKFASEIIAADRDLMSKTYNAAQAAIARGERSATRWVTVMGPQIKKLDELIAVLNDPRIPDGSPVELAGTDFSHEQTLIAEKAETMSVRLADRKNLAIEYGTELLACLDDLMGSRSA
ncbi:integrase [Massilia sp. LC238]|uniref:integrase n=1 Tax=Massilia sp. LC238 TaxID=1502852 RepID=UPI0004E32D5C|nr:integrase [Massilia sp. LC238]KFC76198.1 hypothetical protein FG94_00290 [Massilia sp. LC238]